jgi:AraC-like DNA-binding protein
MNSSNPLTHVQSSTPAEAHPGAAGEQAGLDLVGDAIAAMRTGEPQVARALLQPPWGLRFPALGAAGVHVILKGTAWLLPPDDQAPILLGPGDVALLRRRKPHGLADDPKTPLWDANLAEHVPSEHWPMDGSALDPRTGGTVLIGGTYDLTGVRPHPLLDSLPDVVHLPARVGATTDLRAVVDLLGAELDRDLPGISAATPALLDLLLLYALRAWFEDPATPSPWARALKDPAVSAAIRAIQRHPEQQWTVATLAEHAHLSRAAFARRFADLTGRTPLAYLTWWRMTIAARLLASTDTPLQMIATRTGYGSEYAFSKAFKRELGLAPSKHRTASRERANLLRSRLDFQGRTD